MKNLILNILGWKSKGDPVKYPTYQSIILENLPNGFIHHTILPPNAGPNPNLYERPSFNSVFYENIRQAFYIPHLK